MKSFLIYIFLLYHFSGFSQQSSNIQVEYQLFNDTEIPVTIDAVLYISNNVSIYKLKRSTVKRWEERPTKVTGVDVTNPKNITEPFLKTDPYKKEILFFDDIMGKYFLVKDSYNEFKWNIGNETKIIAGIQCIKATVLYRGREWVAWFAPDIPLPFGPWKLHGLPGLIIEAHDITNKFTMRAAKIEYARSDLFDKDFKTLIQTINTKPITLQQFLKDADEAIDNAISKHNSENSGGTSTRIQIPRSGEELKYEWEE